MADCQMFVKTLISTVALLAVVNAIKVTSPDEDTEWSTSGAHTVTWEAVSTDAESFQIVLDNQVSHSWRRSSRKTADYSLVSFPTPPSFSSLNNLLELPTPKTLLL
jgi:hypothetical protein